MFHETKVLVTGGTGSWGHELIKQLLPQNPREVVIFSRNESTQVAMEREFEDHRLTFCIGDIRDREALSRACKGVDYVFHLAALKHVPVCEEQPYEALKTNVVGTQNVIEAAIENNVKKVMYISTDKAADPSNFYGMTKAIGEKLIVHANLLPSNTAFVCIRGGNVLGTNGSVVHLFMNQLREKRSISITHPQMTRFFMTIEEAIHLLFKVSLDSQGGEIFVMIMPSCRILDLADVLAEEMGIHDYNVIETGIRPGEKMDELLLTEFESKSTLVYDEQYLCILPTLDIPYLKKHYQGYPEANITSYKSDQTLMSKNEIKDMLLKGGFLT